MANPVEKASGALPEFVETMKGLYGEALEALYIYGEAAVGEAGKDHRRVKLLAVMREVGPGELRRYSLAHGKWLKKGIPAPLMLTRNDIDTSGDVFPIEFLEMKETARLLHGTDVLAGLSISHENLRRQCEEQVKGKLIHLRQAYMEAGGDRETITRLVAASIEPFTEAMRNILRLKGKPAPVKREEAIGSFCAEAGLSEGPFMEALGVRREGLKPGMDALEKLYFRYLGEVGKMAEMVDKL